jgi:integrase
MSSIQKRDESTFRVMFRHLGVQRSLSFSSMKKAKEWKNTLEQFLTAHIINLTGVTNGTRASYRGYIKTHMADLGQVPLARLTRTHVSKWINDLSAKGLSGKTIRNLHGFLSGALNEAVRQKLLPENPCAAMRMPPPVHRDDLLDPRGVWTALRPH